MALIITFFHKLVPVFTQCSNVVNNNWIYNTNILTQAEAGWSVYWHLQKPGVLSNSGLVILVCEYLGNYMEIFVTEKQS